MEGREELLLRRWEETKGAGARVTGSRLAGPIEAGPRVAEAIPEKMVYLIE